MESVDIDGLVQDSSFSIANTLGILLSCTKPSYLLIASINSLDVKANLTEESG